jgi:phosphatidylinositol glycan class F
MNKAIGSCYLQLIGITYGICVLMGAPILTDVIRTCLFSIYIVLIGFTPIIISLKGNLKDIYNFICQNELYLTMSSSRKYFFMRNLVWGTIIGAWLGAIPIPLDWDRWWQRWPITCLISSTFGAGFSVIVSYLWLWIRTRQKYNEDIE